MLSGNQWYDRFFKIISIFSFLLILVLLLIIGRVGPASSYEFSIYDAYPWYFWVLLLSALVCGQLVILGSIMSRQEKNYWHFGLGAILLVNAILLFMPIIRGYFMYGWFDVLTHIGYMRDILNTSGIGENFYPAAHILGVTVHLFSGLSLADVTLILPLFFSFFFMVSLYFMGKTIFQTRTELLLLVIVASLLLWGNGQLAFVPNAQAFFLVPLILYLAFKMYYGKNNIKYQFLLLLASFLLVFYHPLVTIMVIMILALMQIMLYIQEKSEKRTAKKVNYLYSIFFILTIFSIWSTYIAMATYVMKPIIGRIFGDENVQSELQKNMEVISQVNVDPLYLIKLILNVWGKSILLGVVSLLCVILILRSMRDKKTKSFFYKGVAVTGFVIFFILSIFMLVSNASFGFGRIYAFANLFSLIVIPCGIYLFVYGNTEKKPAAGRQIVKLLGVLFVFFCLTYFATFNLYYSPIIKQPNEQVPESNYLGMNTFFSIRDDSLSVFELGVVSNRFYDAIFGYSAPRWNIYFNSKNFIPPNHFGYQNQTLSGSFYNSTKYLLVNDKQRRLNPYMNPEFEDKWSFTPEDFERIRSDPGVHLVYTNKDLEIFLLRGSQ